jgi:hypothetical protein
MAAANDDHVKDAGAGVLGIPRFVHGACT